MHPDSLWPPADGPRPRVRLDVPHSGIRSAPKRVRAGSEPLLTTARAVSPWPAAEYPRLPPRPSPVSLCPPFPPAPWPFCGLRPHPPRSRPAEPGGVRGRDRGGLSWVPTLSPGVGRREPVPRFSAARRRSRGINCTNSSNKMLKAAAGASSSRLCPDSLVRGSSRGPWGC